MHGLGKFADVDYVFALRKSTVVNSV